MKATLFKKHELVRMNTVLLHKEKKMFRRKNKFILSV